MTILTTTNEIVCDDHALYACGECTVNEITLDLDGPATIIDLRDFDAVLAAAAVDADVVPLPARRALAAAA